MSRIYCDEINKEVKGFEDVTLYHGFNAFFKSRPIIDSFKDILAHPEYQICSSTKWLGLIGVVVEGDILVASSYDLTSGIDRENNRRYFDEKQLSDLVYDYADLELHEDDDEENNEIVITNVKIKGVWVTSDASNKHKEFAKKLAEKYNLPLIPVGESIFR